MPVLVTDIIFGIVHESSYGLAALAGTAIQAFSMGWCQAAARQELPGAATGRFSLELLPPYWFQIQASSAYLLQVLDDSPSLRQQAVRWEAP